MFIGKYKTCTRPARMPHAFSYSFSLSYQCSLPPVSRYSRARSIWVSFKGNKFNSSQITNTSSGALLQPLVWGWTHCPTHTVIRTSEQWNVYEKQNNNSVFRQKCFQQGQERGQNKQMTPVKKYYLRSALGTHSHRHTRQGQYRCWFVFVLFISVCALYYFVSLC